MESEMEAEVFFGGGVGRKRCWKNLMLEVKYSFSSGVKRCKRKFIFFLFQLFSFFSLFLPLLLSRTQIQYKAMGHVRFFVQVCFISLAFPDRQAFRCPRGKEKKK
jgi:hypothetical protein